MTNPTPALTPGVTDPSVQSSTSAGGRRAKADVAAKGREAGLGSSEEPVKEPRSRRKWPPFRCNTGEVSSPRRSEMAVAESCHDLLAAPPPPWHLMCGSTEQAAAFAIEVSCVWHNARSLNLAAARLAWTERGSLRRGGVGVDLVHPVIIRAPDRCWDSSLRRWLVAVDASQDDAQYKMQDWT